NYGAEMAAKVSAVPGARWHFLGSVQRRLVPALAPHVAVWQSVDRVDEGLAIARAAPGAAVLVQVNVSGEPQKGGVAPAATAALVEQLQGAGLDVRGLMAIGPLGPPEAAREGFRQLARLGRQLALTELSMGMSDDLEVGVQEGATIVRVGRALFGPRPAPGQARN
ncbi:MAG: alanine racemase, partial [Acidimicrobiales bacterium]